MNIMIKDDFQNRQCCNFELFGILVSRHTTTEQSCSQCNATLLDTTVLKMDLFPLHCWEREGQNWRTRNIFPNAFLKLYLFVLLELPLSGEENVMSFLKLISGTKGTEDF